MIGNLFCSRSMAATATSLTLAAALLAFPAPVHAAIPLLNATCGQGIEVHANEGGPIFIDGEEGDLEVFNDNYYEATHSGITISLSINPDGTPSVTFSRRGAGHGVCNLVVNEVEESSSDGDGQAAGLNMQGSGSVVGGGPTTGNLIKGKHGRYVLIINATGDSFACTGVMDDAPGTRIAMTMHINCTDGSSGTAVIRKNNSGNGYTVPFTLTDGKGGFVLFGG